MLMEDEKGGSSTRVTRISFETRSGGVYGNFRRNCEDDEERCQNVLENDVGRKYRRQGWWVLRCSSKTDIETLIRAFINVIGATLFAVGSLGWVAGFPNTGTFLFAGSNVLCYCVSGTWWAIAARSTFKSRYQREASGFDDQRSIHRMHPGLVESPESALPQLDSPDVIKAFRILSHMEMMAASWQVLGAIAFTVGCFTSYWLGDSFYNETVLFWFAGSFFFLLQGMISQIICESFWGPLLPFWPRCWKISRSNITPYSGHSCCVKRRMCIHRCIPGAMLNFMGSLIFSLASVCLWYESSEWVGGWGYLIGSLFFVVAAVADINGFLDALALRSILYNEEPCEA